MRRNAAKMTQEHKDALLGIENWTNVYREMHARLLREIHSQRPDFLSIVSDLDELQWIVGYKIDLGYWPRFGAIATAQGIEWAKQPEF